MPSRATHAQVADAIEEAFPSVVVEGNEEKEGRPGSFEVAAAGEGEARTTPQVFSRLDSQQLPDPQDIIARIANRNRRAAEPSQTTGAGCG